MKKDEFIKQFEKDFGLSNLSPNKSFERRLKKAFINESLDKKTRSYSFIKKSFWMCSIVLTLTLSFFAALSLYSSSNSENNIKAFEILSEENSRSTLMPMFSNITEINSNEIDRAMNISQIPQKQNSYNSVTTTTLEYGLDFESCTNIFKFDKNISKVITYELFDNESYKFKTHVFNNKGEEIDILIYDSNTYSSTYRNQTLGDGEFNTQSIETFTPKNIRKVGNNKLEWSSEYDCNGKNTTIINKVEYDPNWIIKNYEVSIEGSKTNIYQATFEYNEMSIQDLILIDELFR